MDDLSADGREQRLRAWASAFEGLTPASLDGLVGLADPEIRFRDPFNDITGHAAFRAIFEDMFETCEHPSFTVRDVALSEKAGYIRWSFTFRPKAIRSRPTWTIEGMSEVTIGRDGLVTAHVDHWDGASGILARLPGIGFLVRQLLRRLSSNPKKING